MVSTVEALASAHAQEQRFSLVERLFGFVDMPGLTPHTLFAIEEGMRAHLLTSPTTPESYEFFGALTTQIPQLNQEIAIADKSLLSVLEGIARGEVNLPFLSNNGNGDHH